MKIDIMRFIDRRLGTIVLIALLPFRLIHDFLQRNEKEVYKNPDDVTEIFISKYFGMGSILLATPMIKSIRRRFKNAKIVFVTFESNRKFCEDLEEIDEIITFDTKNPIRFTSDVVRFILNYHRPSIFIDLEFYANFPLIITVLSGSKLNLAFIERQLLRKIYINKPVYFNYRKHMVEIFHHFGVLLGVEEEATHNFSKLHFTHNHLRKVEEMTKGFNEIILVNPNASNLSYLRIWPEYNFANLIEHLSQNKNRLVVMIGGKEDRAHNEEVLAMVAGPKDNIKNVAGLLNLNETFALLSVGKLLITNDSGPLHWAVALDTPTVSFFGPETPELYGPVEASRHKVFYSGMYCSPCMNVLYDKLSKCKDNVCLKKITLNEVLETVYNILQDPALLSPIVEPRQEEVLA